MRIHACVQIFVNVCSTPERRAELRKRRKGATLERIAAVAKALQHKRDVEVRQWTRTRGKATISTAAAAAAAAGAPTTSVATSLSALRSLVASLRK